MQATGSYCGMFVSVKVGQETQKQGLQQNIAGIHRFMKIRGFMDYCELLDSKNVKNLNKLNQRELELGLTTKKSWHDKYKDSAWIFIGGLPYDLTEGDVLCIFSQYGEIVNVNLVRDQKTGKSKGFCFLCYEDQRSTILSVDNFNGAKVLGRTLRVDHVEEYRKPKDHGDEDDLTKKLRAEGCAPKVESSPEPEEDLLPIKPKKEKKAKKEKRKKKKKKKGSSSSDNSSDSEEDERSKNKVKTKPEPNLVKVKHEKHDSGYDRALEGGMSGHKRSYNETDNQRDSKYAGVSDYGEVGRGDVNTDRYTGRDRNVGSAINSERDKYRDRDRFRVRERSRDRDRFGDSDTFRDRDRLGGRERSRERERFEDKQRSRDREGFGDRQRSRDNYRAESRDREQSRDRERLRDRERGGDRSGDRERHFDRDDRTSFHRQKELGRNKDLQSHRGTDMDFEADRNRNEGRYYGNSSRESGREGHRDRENRHNSRDQRERDEEYRRNTSDKRSDKYRDRH